MKAAWTVCVVIGIVACHRAPEVQPRGARELGEFSFRIKETPIYGKFTVLADTVTLEAQGHSCGRFDTGASRPGIYSFRCLGGSGAFNVRVFSGTPLGSTWYTATPVKKSSEVCTRYETTEQGRRICTSTRTEVRTDTVRNGGSLDVTRLAPTAKP